jgi:hypothetical protein
MLNMVNNAKLNWTSQKSEFHRKAGRNRHRTPNGSCRLLHNEHKLPVRIIALTSSLMGGPEQPRAPRHNVDEERQLECAWQETVPNSVEWNLVSEIQITKIILESDL